MYMSYYKNLFQAKGRGTMSGDEPKDGTKMPLVKIKQDYSTFNKQHQIFTEAKLKDFSL